MVDHPTLANALAVLTPAAIVSTRYQLTTPLLNGCYEMHSVTGKRCTLTTDGWTDVNADSVINYVLICGSETFFLEAAYSDQRRTTPCSWRRTSSV
jgi:hypothetical protein